MIFDRQTLLSDAQAITATGPSTNVINLGPIRTGLTRDIGKGEPIPFLMQVVESFNNLTSLAVTIQTDDNEAFASPKAVIINHAHAGRPQGRQDHPAEPYSARHG